MQGISRLSSDISVYSSLQVGKALFRDSLYSKVRQTSLHPSCWCNIRKFKESSIIVKCDLEVIGLMNCTCANDSTPDVVKYGPLYGVGCLELHVLRWIWLIRGNRGISHFFRHHTVRKLDEALIHKFRDRLTRPALYKIQLLDCLVTAISCSLFVKETIRSEQNQIKRNELTSGGPYFFFYPQKNDHVVRRNTCEDRYRYTTTTWAFSIGFFKHVNHLVRYVALDEQFHSVLEDFCWRSPVWRNAAQIVLRLSWDRSAWVWFRHTGSVWAGSLRRKRKN